MYVITLLTWLGSVKVLLDSKSILMKHLKYIKLQFKYKAENLYIV